MSSAACDFSSEPWHRELPAVACRESTKSPRIPTTVAAPVPRTIASRRERSPPWSGWNRNAGGLRTPPFQGAIGDDHRLLPARIPPKQEAGQDASGKVNGNRGRDGVMSHFHPASAALSSLTRQSLDALHGAFMSKGLRRDSFGPKRKCQRRDPRRRDERQLLALNHRQRLRSRVNSSWRSRTSRRLVKQQILRIKFPKNVIKQLAGGLKLSNRARSRSKL